MHTIILNYTYFLIRGDLINIQDFLSSVYFCTVDPGDYDERIKIILNLWSILNGNGKRNLKLNISSSKG